MYGNSILGKMLRGRLRSEAVLLAQLRGYEATRLNRREFCGSCTP